MFEGHDCDIISQMYQTALRQLANKDKEIELLKTEIQRLNTIIEEQDNNRLKLARSC